MTAGEVPTVKVGHPKIPGGITLSDVLLLECSACGELTDWEPLGWRPMLQRQAAVHAREIHDDLVTRDGWA